MFRRFATCGFMLAVGGLVTGFLAGNFTPEGHTAHAHPVPLAEPLPHPVTPAPTEPAVKPGLVRWHPSLDAACAAAKESRKPVLVFHMMGQLDRLFC